MIELLPVTELVDLVHGYTQQELLLLLTSRSVSEELAIYNPSARQWTLETVPHWTATLGFVHGRLLRGECRVRGDGHYATDVQVLAAMRTEAYQWIDMPAECVPSDLWYGKYDVNSKTWVSWSVDRLGSWSGSLHSALSPVECIREEPLPAIHSSNLGLMSDLTEWFALAVNGMHIVGDNRPEQHFLWRLSPAARSWTRSSTMHVKRERPAACKWGDNAIAVVGGDCRSWEVYDISTDTWTLMTSCLRQSRNRHQVVVLEGRLVVCDGSTDNTWNGSVETYDPVKDAWCLLPALPPSRVSTVTHGLSSRGQSTIWLK